MDEDYTEASGDDGEDEPEEALPVQRYVFIDGSLCEESLGEDVETVSLEFEQDRDCDAPQVPLDWVNSARIRADAEDDELTVAISVGDPRGAFSMSIRRFADGTLRLYLPYEGMGFAHMPIRKVNDGVYEIGGA